MFSVMIVCECILNLCFGLSISLLTFKTGYRAIVVFVLFKNGYSHVCVCSRSCFCIVCFAVARLALRPNFVDYSCSLFLCASAHMFQFCRLFICMYVCMYVGMYVCLHTCMYICIYVYICMQIFMYKFYA